MIKNVDSCLIGNVYISWPITGVENWQDNFLQAEKELLELPGTFFVVNPIAIARDIENLFAKIEKNARLYRLYAKRYKRTFLL